MKIIYLDLGMGAAGDMLMAALYELLDEKGKESFLTVMNASGLDGVSIEAQKSCKCGICGTHMNVTVDGCEEGDHGHDHHDHEHHHDHHHSDMHDIGHMIDHMPVSDNVKSNAKAVYSLIAEAESRAHDKPVTEVHFHEVGMKDAIVDVTGVCLLFEMIGADKIIASPVCTGFGKVKCAHGILPVPAPATANILNGIPVYAGNIEGELCTPTGAALVKHFVREFMNMPVMTADATGYGMGKKDFEAANCVRAILGETTDNSGKVVELSCNVDDMTAEDIGFATGLLIEEGALDVYTTPIGMKKSRPGTKITVMCLPEEKMRFAKLMFKHTTTIGIRENSFERYTLTRKEDTLDTSYGKIGVKVSEGYGVRRKKYEYDDIRSIAKERDMSAYDIRTALDRECDGE